MILGYSESSSKELKQLQLRNERRKMLHPTFTEFLVIIHVCGHFFQWLSWYRSGMSRWPNPGLGDCRVKNRKMVRWLESGHKNN